MYVKKKNDPYTWSVNNFFLKTETALLSGVSWAAGSSTFLCSYLKKKKRLVSSYAVSCGKEEEEKGLQLYRKGWCRHKSFNAVSTRYTGIKYFGVYFHGFSFFVCVRVSQDRNFCQTVDNAIKLSTNWEGNFKTTWKMQHSKGARREEK